MPNSKAPSISGTASTSRASRAGGVELTTSTSRASSTSAGGAVIYTPSMTTDEIRTPTASLVSVISTSLNAVFARLGIEHQQNALRSLDNSVLSRALGCTQREVASLMVTSSGDELWATFCQLNVENRKKALENVRKHALRKAFEKESDEDARSTANLSSIAPVAPSEATTDTLASFFKKLSVEDQEKALAAVDVTHTPKKSLRRGTNGWGLDHIGEETGNDETLLETKPDLAEWQELCRACGEEVVPESIQKCKAILKTKNVALSDLSEAIEQGTVAQTFPSLTKLRKYVQSQNKVANKAATKENKFLKKMLRELFRYRSPPVG